MARHIINQLYYTLLKGIIQILLFLFTNKNNTSSINACWNFFAFDEGAAFAHF